MRLRVLGNILVRAGDFADSAKQEAAILQPIWEGPTRVGLPLLWLRGR